LVQEQVSLTKLPWTNLWKLQTSGKRCRIRTRWLQESKRCCKRTSTSIKPCIESTSLVTLTQAPLWRIIWSTKTLRAQKVKSLRKSSSLFTTSMRTLLWNFEFTCSDSNSKNSQLLSKTSASSLCNYTTGTWTSLMSSTQVSLRSSAVSSSTLGGSCSTPLPSFKSNTNKA